MEPRCYPKTNFFVSLFIGMTLLLSLPANPVAASTSNWSAPKNILSSGHTYLVNSTLDAPNADAATGICADAAGRCTLRAAIMAANFVTGADTILLPAGVYLLTRPGYDNAALVGDLDISDDLTILGAGSGTTIVDGNGSVTSDRVFQILKTANNVTFKGLTIRNGKSLASTVGVIGGGGLYMEGAGNLTLNDVVFSGNTAQNGGGLYLNLSSLGGTVVMEHVTVDNNTVIAGGVGAGGGAYVYLPSSTSSLDIQDSQIYSNTADGTGGGLFVQGNNLVHWSIETSAIYSNKAASGAGIGNFVPLTLTDSQLHDNQASFDGGGIEAFSPLAISLTTLNANTAGRFGGGIFDLSTASTTSSYAFDTIDQSTLSNNFAKDGGGIYHDGFIDFNGLLTLTNSTLSGNGVSEYGGGLYVYGGQATILNATIANNGVHLGFPTPGPGIGGGLYASSPSASVLTIEDTILAKNWRGNGIVIPTADDCVSSGNTGTLAYTLLTTTTNCFITGAQIGNIVGQDPLLTPLQYNGGPTLTQDLLGGSPAIDTGAPAGCPDAAGNALTVDQRGISRPQGAQCDIGAVEAASAISGNAGIGAARLSYFDGSAKTAAADGSGNYFFTVSNNWTGTATPSSPGYRFTPNHIDYTNVTTEQTSQDYTVTAVATFADVPVAYWAWSYIERLYAAGITGGCGAAPLIYCPDSNVTRAQMAVFLEKALHGPTFNPPIVPLTFTDTAGNFAQYWIEALKSDGITTGCGGTLYCPNAAVTRAQMALFLLKAQNGSSYAPPAATGIKFSDVPASYWAAAWIEQLANESITGGCGTNTYCPDISVTRAQMAVFLVKTFKLP